jgi:hypothetical protein
MNQEESDFRSLEIDWKDVSCNPILYEVKGIASPIKILDDTDLIKDKANILSTLHSLLRMVDIIDNPSVAVSFEDLEELGLLFGTLLLDVNENLHLNPEVFEDPLNRSDSLGNVRMISRKIPAMDSQAFHVVGRVLLDALHEAHLVHERLEKTAQGWSSLMIGSWDDTSTEEILSAKQFASRLRRENNRLENRNEKLYILRCKDKQRLLRQKRSLLKVLASAYSSFHGRKTKLFELLEQNAREIGLCTSDFMRLNKIRSRKSKVVSRSLKSQLDCLRWD